MLASGTAGAAVRGVASTRAVKKLERCCLCAEEPVGPLVFGVSGWPSWCALTGACCACPVPSALNNQFRTVTNRGNPTVYLKHSIAMVTTDVNAM